MSATIALQKPKDISLSEIEAELSRLWVGQESTSGIATRAATFSMVVYEPEEFQQLLGALGFYKGAIDSVHGPETREAIHQAQSAYGLRTTARVDSETLQRLRQEYQTLPDKQKTIRNMDLRGASVSDAIASRNPSRIISLCPTLGPDTGVKAQVSAYCPIQKSKSRSLMCCEYVTLRGTKEALERVADLVAGLLIPDLPKFLWWKATPNPEQELFGRLSAIANCTILDSCYFSEPASEFIKINRLVEQESYIADLNWHRLLPWQELTASMFDPPERRAALGCIDDITIDYEKGNDAQALMFLSWLASRLGWQPKGHEFMGGQYEIQHVTFEGSNGREIKAELAAIPTSDFGEIPGDLIGLSLNSQDPNANCCTILCSETTGCMRMESGGSAQSCRTELVTALPDQKAAELMAQQLQRWGREILFEESLAVMINILKLR
ncbi:MAG: glucose-6-phosphate dehydrogenase assembly protein OpcA [Cyanobacteria bacterium P01_F01_bin.153]